jgi:methylamine dehydrogenase accessory protein MauD
VNEALWISNVLLWLALVALAALVLALLRQIGLLHERIAPAGALVGREGPRPGEQAPVLEVEDWSGASLRIGGSDAEGRDTFLFFVSPTCPVCKSLLPLVGSVCAAEDGQLRLVVASDGPRDEHGAFVDAQHLDRGHYVLSTPLGLAYQVGRLPYAVLIDASGVLRARGLVNSREHLESLFEARDRGVGSVQEYLARDAGPRRVA